VLVGPNNEGKSNVIKGLVAAIGVLKQWRQPLGGMVERIRRQSIPIAASGLLHALTARPKREPAPRFSIPSFIYDWDNDFPISLQESNGERSSVFNLEFELQATEIQEFKSEVRSSLNGTLPLEISVNQNNKATITVTKRGRGGPALSSKSNVIARFVSNRLEFEYIPAIRTAESAEKVVNSMLEESLRLSKERLNTKKQSTRSASCRNQYLKN
jgi:putative ATP-dependent endonuclease of the OLD family